MIAARNVLRSIGLALAPAALSLLAACSASRVSSAPVLATQGVGPGADAHAAPDTGGATVPTFSTSFTYSGKKYAVKMVGTDPTTSSVTTTVNDQVVPVKLVFSNGVSLDGAAQTSTLTGSPIWINGSYPEGTTQYGDALMRSEFWTYTQSTTYHLLLGTPTVEPTQRIVVPSADGFTTGTGSSLQGFVAYAWFIQTIEPQLLQSLSIDPHTLTIFLTQKTQVLEQNGHCCFNGYHNSFPITISSGPATFTTAWSSVSSKNVTHMAHEIAEWMNDPFYTNAVPKWVDPVSGACGGGKLEVGDPTASFLYTVNGYHVEDMTFYSWFTRTSPSIGINGQYDMRNMLTGPAAVCP